MIAVTLLVAVATLVVRVITLAVFSAAEGSVRLLTRARTRRLLEAERPGATALDALMDRPSRLAAAGSVWRAIAFVVSALVVSCVGTPGHGNGTLDLSYVRRVCEQIGAALKETDEYKVVVVRSTMLPGSMASVVIPAEAEEEAFRQRNVRLAEKGLLPFEEAVGIYQPLPAGRGPGRTLAEQTENMLEIAQRVGIAPFQRIIHALQPAGCSNPQPRSPSRPPPAPDNQTDHDATQRQPHRYRQGGQPDGKQRQRRHARQQQPQPA